MSGGRFEYPSKKKIGKLEQRKDSPGQWIIVCEECPDNVEFVGKEYADPIGFALDSKDLEIKQLSDFVDAQKRNAAKSKARSIYYRGPEQHKDKKLPSLYSLMNPEVKKKLTDDDLDAAGGVGGEGSKGDGGADDGGAAERSAAGGSVDDRGGEGFTNVKKPLD